MANPYDPPTAPVEDCEPLAVARPRSVTIALVILWAMVAIWAFGVVRQILRFGFMVGPMSGAYLVFVLGMTFIPAFLLVMIGYAKHWARVTLIALDGVVLITRIYMLMTLAPAPAMVLKSIILSTGFQMVAFVLLCLPSSNAWFRFNRR